MKLLALACLVCMAASAHAEDFDAKRKVAVLEYRSGSSALPGVASAMVTELTKQTSLKVLGPEQTKTVYGEGLEQAIVRCAGEADCVAKIGAKVGAAEVILVGVSELGDVILTMQRIDVGKRTVTARIAESLDASKAPTGKDIDGYLGRLLPPSDFLRFGVIAIVANEVGAAVTIGGEKRGVTPIDPLKLRAPATYSIRIDKEGFVPFTTKVQLPPDSELKVEAELSHRGRGADHWYQKWYVLTGIGIVTAGVVGGGIYYATREPPSSVGVGGTIN
jgi:hypothetical protein